MTTVETIAQIPPKGSLLQSPKGSSIQREPRTRFRLSTVGSPGESASQAMMLSRLTWEGGTAYPLATLDKGFSAAAGVALLK
jgi:hypothetical protein